ncbi:MAG: FHA domain-containing protein [Chloroflexi bacterium]|nr:FHA domain-containing protein [Chloroflexota bacterium]
MSTVRIFVVCAPVDYDWTRSLVNRLEVDGYPIYLPPDDDEPDPKVQRRTAIGLQRATIMLAVISPDSAVGASAPAFEAWWRPFMESGRPVIGCIVPSAPPGVENWMPFDLYRHSPLDFGQTDAYQQLRDRLPPPPPKRPMPPLEASTPGDSTKPESPPESPANDSEPAPLLALPAPAQSPDPPLETTREKDKPRLARRIINWASIVLGMIVVPGIWIVVRQATKTSDIPAGIWFLVVISTAAGLYAASRWVSSQVARRQMLRERRAAAQYAETRARPPVYLEIIESKQPAEIGAIWAIDNTELTIGHGPRAHVPLRDRRIKPTHCVIFYDTSNQQYYLENTGGGPTTLVGQPLASGDTAPLQNGDLIAVGKDTVLQFRYNASSPE